MAEEIKKEAEEETSKNNETKVVHRGRKKNITFVSQIIIAVWIAFWCGLQFYKQIMSGNFVPVWDFILSACAIGLPFSPTYISIILDKVRDIKLDKLIHK